MFSIYKEINVCNKVKVSIETTKQYLPVQITGHNVNQPFAREEIYCQKIY